MRISDDSIAHDLAVCATPWFAEKASNGHLHYRRASPEIANDGVQVVAERAANAVQSGLIALFRILSRLESSDIQPAINRLGQDRL